jgi:hypothetical protein
MVSHVSRRSYRLPVVQATSSLPLRIQERRIVKREVGSAANEVSRHTEKSLAHGRYEDVVEAVGKVLTYSWNGRTWEAGVRGEGCRAVFPDRYSRSSSSETEIGCNVMVSETKTERAGQAVTTTHLLTVCGRHGGVFDVVGVCQQLLVERTRH